MFLDRDGVINHDHGYVYEIEKFEFIDGVFDACRYFISLGYEIIVITNQSGIGRGYYTQEDFLNLTNWMIKEFSKNGIEILKVYFCPHSPTEDCDCRKPKIGMITQSLNDFSIDLQNSWLIGDKISDIQTAINANIPNRILIGEDSNSLFDTINIIKNEANNEI
ncbi:D-glycero-beta-D-manno-heptose 1,7-bisphosphate 7-phosphatase [Arcobacter aquimarinus]|uniref:D-glycero-beta-D-manno-heptose 1,7-bisphosphate 7-phosphatase n=1 Tax=Arcobacter aquimarinus TaxID=1315211 RepID=UPI00100BBC32|nr:D-glycero-beta-D-manno-heptose 1,7-bisphosphate 7-phosphatase [Arcobacter aquimarinus]RXI32808.1 D-glycero-beta-D-manno-heptose-1,7-bisphosphate 7-phosphatase [Arcobacter aquimarinus]